jgi:hypothetical protein
MINSKFKPEKIRGKWLISLNSRTNETNIRNFTFQ